MTRRILTSCNGSFGECAEDGLKKCPWCAELIKAEAISKYCGSAVGTIVSVKSGQVRCGEAVAALVLGLIPFTCVPSLSAIIFGHIALSKIKQTHGTLKGRGIAIWGLVSGYFFTDANILFGFAIGIGG